jgi:hypothetical protein
MPCADKTCCSTIVGPTSTGQLRSPAHSLDHWVAFAIRAVSDGDSAKHSRNLMTGCLQTLEYPDHRPSKKPASHSGNDADQQQW